MPLFFRVVVSTSSSHGTQNDLVTLRFELEKARAEAKRLNDEKYSKMVETKNKNDYKVVEK